MRSDKEKKSIIKSIKVSPEQEEQIMQKADDKNMNFSQYMVDCAIHGSQGVTPALLIKMQEMMNIVEEISDNLNEQEYIRRLENSRKNFDEIFLSASPKEKFNQLRRNTSLFIEMGEEIWESLK